MKNPLFPLKADIFTFHIPITEQQTLKQTGSINPTIISWSGMWNRMRESSKANQQGMAARHVKAPRASLKPQPTAPLCFVLVDVTQQTDVWRWVKQMARRRDDPRWNGWADECKSARSLRARECMWECARSGCAVCVPGGGLLLQVAVDFKAVVSRIGNHHVSVGGKSQSLRAVQRVCWRVDVRQERTAAVKHLTQRQNGKSASC